MDLQGQGLGFRREYAVEATATNASGAPTTIDRTIKTVNPKTLVQISSVSVADDVTVGVGMPVRVTFDAPVKNKKAVEEQLQVKTSTPVTGAWNWESDTVVVFRPKKYWPANTTIEVVMPLRRQDRTRRLWLRRTEMSPTKTGDSMVSIYDANKARP